MKTIFKILGVLVILTFLVAGCNGVAQVDENATDENIEEAEMPSVDEVTDEEVAGPSEGAEAAAEETEEESAAEVKVFEGELVNVQVSTTGNGIEFTYSEPLNESGQWQTQEGDAGMYNVVITASDGKTTSSKTFKLLVKKKNQPPAISQIDDFSVTVGDTIVFEPEASDPDGDDVELSYSGWMNSNTKEVTEADVGKHKVTIKASDGTDSVKQTVEVTVIEGNRAPAIQKIADIEAFEGDLIAIEPEVSDADGDEVTVSFSKPLDENGEWQTGYDDAGDYTATITASDGEKESELEVKITVVNKLSPDDWDFEVKIN